MLFYDLCLKIAFWPYLAYLARLKGFCPPTAMGTTTMRPTLTTVTMTPFTMITLPTTMPACPAEPLACLAGGMRPIPYCPCIDPRYQKYKLHSATNTNTGDVLVFADLHSKKSASKTNSYAQYP